MSHRLVLEGKETGPVGKAVVVATGAGAAALVQQLQVARVDSHGLVVGDLDEITVGDIVGPGGTAVGLAGEGARLGASVDGPGAVEAGGSEGAEVTAVGALGLEDHEVAAAALDGVDLDGLEDVLSSVAQDDGGGGAEAAGEVGLGDLGVVDLAVVAGEEQMHRAGVTNDGLVDRASAGARDGASEESLSGTPAVGVGGVAGGPVGEGSGTPLVAQNPDLLGRVVEEGGGNGVEAHAVLRGRGHVAPVGEGAEVHGAILAAGVVVGGVDNVLAVQGGGGEVLERGPARLGLSESTGRGPLVRGGQLAARGRRSRSQEREGSSREAEVRWNETHFCGWRFFFKVEFERK